PGWTWSPSAGPWNRPPTRSPPPACARRSTRCAAPRTTGTWCWTAPRCTGPRTPASSPTSPISSSSSPATAAPPARTWNGRRRASRRARWPGSSSTTAFDKEAAMPRRSRICVAVLLAVAASHPAPADAVRIDYSLDLGVEHNDNVAMDAFDPQSQNILQAGLGYTITEETSTVRLMLTGRADYLHYEEVYSDRLDAMLRGRFDWMAVPDRLQLTVEDTMTTRPVDGLLPDTPANRQRINTFSAGPTLFFRWGGTTEGAAEARFIRDTAEETRELNAKRLATTLSASREFDGTSRISVHGGMEWIDYDHDDAARDVDRQDLFARYERDLAQL